MDDNLKEIMEDGTEIMRACRRAVLEAFNIGEIKPEHIACINSMFIWATKQKYFRKA